MHKYSLSKQDKCARESAVLQDILRRIGSNVESCLLNKIAEDPVLLDDFHTIIKSSMDSGAIHYSAGVIRDTSWDLVREMDTMSNGYLDWLKTQNYSREDCRQIRYVVESFYYFEPIFAVFAAIAGRWLSGGMFEGNLPEIINRGTVPVFRGRVKMAGKHKDINSLYNHPFYRALLVWPECFDWAVSGPELQDRLESTSTELNKLLDTVINKMPVDTAIADKRDIKLAMIASIGNYLNESLKVIAHACILRRLFIKSEISARSK